MPVKIGIIGGSGLDNPDIISDKAEKSIDTPYGKPSDSLIEGKIHGVECVLLARHGRKHNINPSNVNYRANIWALKLSGCTHILVTTACGSLREEIQPGDIVILDQFIDRTTKRQSTFYDGETLSGVLHIPMHTPFCPKTRKVFVNTSKLFLSVAKWVIAHPFQVLIEVANELGYKCHPTGTTVTIEGPRFSSRAESHLFQSWGAQIVNMTTVPEVVLAKELGLCYAAVALPTDYDCWRETQEAVSVEGVLTSLKCNVHKATQILLKAIPKINSLDWSDDIERNKKEIDSAKM